MVFEQREVFQQHAHPQLDGFYELKKKGGSLGETRPQGRKLKKKKSSRATQHLSNVIKINIGQRLEEELKEARQSKNSSFSGFRLAPPNINFAAPPKTMTNDAYAVPNNLSTNTLIPRQVEARHTYSTFSESPHVQEQNQFQVTPVNPKGISAHPARETLTPMYGKALSPLIHVDVPTLEEIQRDIERRAIEEKQEYKPTGRDNIPLPKVGQQSSMFGGYTPLRGEQPKDRRTEFHQEKSKDRSMSSSEALAPPSQQEAEALRDAVSMFRPPPGSGRSISSSASSSSSSSMLGSMFGDSFGHYEHDPEIKVTHVKDLPGELEEIEFKKRGGRRNRKSLF